MRSACKVRKPYVVRNAEPLYAAEAERRAVAAAPGAAPGGQVLAYQVAAATGPSVSASRTPNPCALRRPRRSRTSETVGSRVLAMVTDRQGSHAHPGFLDHDDRACLQVVGDRVELGE